MKSIIDGKRYDTENADHVAEWCNTADKGDFYRVSELLCQTDSGSWFVAGEGGGMSKYGKAVSGGWTAGSRIRPLSEREAMQWLERHEKNEALEEHFAEKIEDA